MKLPNDDDLSPAREGERADLRIGYQPLQASHLNAVTLFEERASTSDIRLSFDETVLREWRQRIANERRRRVSRDAYERYPEDDEDSSLIKLGLNVLSDAPFE